MCLCNVYVYFIRKLAYAEQSGHGSVAHALINAKFRDASFGAVQCSGW